MTDTSFFDESREQSRIKSRIVTKYFWAWAKIMISAARRREGRIAYMDLFAGPGRYSDGTLSTPVTVLQTAIKEADFREMLVTIFNDKNPTNVKSLREIIGAIPGIETLKYKPQIENEEVGQKIVDRLEGIRLIPTLLFVDPWGYKGLSLGLIKSVLQNWGCDFVFFFNYNRINPGLNNDAVREHMNDLFGAKRAEMIRERLAGLGPDEREGLIMEELSQALRELGATYVLPFTFKNEQGTRTKHHLVFGSKNVKGYEIMKEIMAGESSEQNQGVGSFVYSPASIKNPTLFELTRPLDDLENLLLAQFAGERLTMRAIYERHNVGRPYIKTHYKKALAKMEASGTIMAEPLAEKRRKVKGEVTFADDVTVAFPRGARK
ncbi:MAG: three-Cys-motif partner protein TcmP [Candidatus Acidiferrales bacterium]